MSTKQKKTLKKHFPIDRPKSYQKHYYRASSLDVEEMCQITSVYLFPIKSIIKLSFKPGNHIKGFASEITRVHPGSGVIRALRLASSISKHLLMLALDATAQFDKPHRKTILY